MLLRKIHVGELPVQEVSRENLKDFLVKQLQVSLSWDKFDAICQRVDPDKKGFISFSPCLHAFQHLHPLLEKLQTFHILQENNVIYQKYQPHLPAIIRQKYQDNFANIIESQRQFCIVMILTLATEHLMTHNSYYMKKKLDATAMSPVPSDKHSVATPSSPLSSPRKGKGAASKARTLDEIFFDIVSKGQDQFPSFQKYMQQLNSKMYYMQNPFAIRDIILDEKKASQIYESKLIEFQLFVTDFLFHLSQNFVKLLQSIWSENKIREKFFRFIGSESKSAFMVTSLYFLIQNHYEVCSHIAKGLHVYQELVIDGTEDILVPTGELLMGLLHFRLLHLSNPSSFLSPAQRSTVNLKDTTTTTIPQTPDSPAPLSATALSTTTKKTLGDHDMDLCSRIELWNEISGNPMKLPSPHKIYDLEHMLCRSFGIAIPIVMYPLTMQVDSKVNSATVQGTSSNNINSFAASTLEAIQYQVESIQFYVIEYAKEWEELENDEAMRAKVTFANSSTLKSLQKSLHSELWESKTLVDDLSKNVKTVKPDLAESHLISKTNELLHQQRIDQITAYLEYLNQKATSKKKILRSLLELWQSTKVMIEDHNLISSSTAKDLINPDVAHKHSISNEKKRQAAMPKESIIDQTRAIQNLLLKDMQSPVPTKIASVSAFLNCYCYCLTALVIANCFTVCIVGRTSQYFTKRVTKSKNWQYQQARW